MKKNYNNLIERLKQQYLKDLATSEFISRELKREDITLKEIKILKQIIDERSKDDFLVVDFIN